MGGRRGRSPFRLRARAGAVVGLLAIAGSIGACWTSGPRYATPAELRGPWGGRPFELEPALVTEIDAACRALFERFGDRIGPGFELAVIDARGDGVVNAWFADAAGPSEWCTDVPITEAGTVGELRNFGRGDREVPFDEIDPDDIWVFSEWFDREAPIRHWMIGYAGAEVVRVELATLAGRPIEAALDDGWWAVWVPGDVQRGPQIKGFGADGTEITNIPARSSD